MWVVWLATENITTGRIPLFYERDDAFLAYIRELTKDTVTSRDELADELDKVWYIFSHIILSNYNLATEFDYSALREVECQNGFRMLVRRPAEDVILIVGISPDIAGTSLSEVHRRLDMLLTILTFLFGPSYDFHLSRKATLEQRRHNWDTISLLLNKWHQMFNTEQCYLVEAIEEITTDTAYGARARPGEAMEDKVEAILNEARKIVQLKLGCTYDYVIHTMLVVESKIVQFNSSEKDRSLSPYDMLLMLLSSLSYFPSNMVPEDLFSRTQRRIDCASSILSEDSDEDHRLELPANSDGGGSDRYFDNVMLDEDLTATEPSDSQSVTSTHSNEDYASISSESVDKARRRVEFSLGDSKLPPTSREPLEQPNKDSISDSRLNGTTAGLGQALASLAKTQCEFVESLNHLPDKTVTHSSLPHTTLPTCSSKLFSEVHSPVTDVAENCVQVSAATLPAITPASINAKGFPLEHNHCDSNMKTIVHSQISNFSVDLDPTVKNIPNGLILEDKLLEHIPTSNSSNALQTDDCDLVPPDSQSTFHPHHNCNVPASSNIKVPPAYATDGSALAAVQLTNGLDETKQSPTIGSIQPADVSKSINGEQSHSLSVTTPQGPVDGAEPIVSYSAVEETLSPHLLTDQIIPKARVTSMCVNNNNATLDSIEQEAADFSQTMESIKENLHTHQTIQSPTTSKRNVGALTSTKSPPLSASQKHFSLSRSLPRFASQPTGRERKETRRVVSMSGSVRRGSIELPVPRRRHRSLQERGNDSADQLTDEYYSAPSPQHSPVLHRRPSADSEASYHTATTLMRPGPEYPLDTEKLLHRALAMQDPQHMIKGVFIHKRVFLRSSLCEYVPACLYIISVSPGINVVVAAEITDHHKPNKFVEVLNQLTRLLNPRCFDNRKLPPERLIDQMAEKLKDLVKLITVRIHDSAYKKQLDTTIGSWQRIAPLLRKCYREEEKTIPYDLRKNILKISEELKRSFRALYMAVTDLSNDAGDHMHRLQLYANKKLRFYKRILMVKANRNMAMSAFQNDKYPGLVHFLYINRNNNTMKSPSIQLPKEDDSTEALVIRDMKERLWKLLPWMYKQLSNGYTSISVKDGDFVFTFDLFMYNEVHYRFLPKMVAYQSLYSPPKNTIGDMKGHFYKRLIKITDSVAGLKCLELLTVHFAVIPRDVITKQRTLLLENELHKKHDPLSTY